MTERTGEIRGLVAYPAFPQASSEAEVPLEEHQ